MNLEIPQMIYLSLIIFGLGISIVKHGKTKEGKNNFFTDLIGSIIVVSLLYWGGFFK